MVLRNKKRRKKNHRRKSVNKRQKLKVFESTGQSESLNTLGTKAEYINTWIRYAICFIIFIIGFVLIYIGIKDAVAVKIGEISINCNLVGIVVCILSIIGLWLSKPKVVLK